MSIVTILAEKPSAKKNIAKALGGTSGTFNGDSYVIVALRGHLLEFDEPQNMVSEQLREYYHQWSTDNLPWNYTHFNWNKVLNNKSHQAIIAELADALDKSDELVIATDDDPSGEGDLIAWEAINKVGWKGPVSRMHFADESKSELQKGYRAKTIIENRDTNPSYLMADTRSKWDYLSMQFTRAASVLIRQKGYNSLLRQGRLKSVIVSLVGQQEDLLASWIKKPYYELRYKDKNGNVFRITADDVARYDSADEVIFDANEKCTVVIDGKEEKHTAPPKLPDLMTLSAELAKEGYKPKAVLDTYQKLYEDQYVSYPRTEDKIITLEQFKELEQIADQIADLIGVNKTLLTHRTARSKHISSSATHGANRPGPRVPHTLDDLSSYGACAKDIYIYLAKRWLAMLCDDYRYDSYTAHLQEHPNYTSTSNVGTYQGFKTILTNTESEDDSDPNTPNNTRPFSDTAKPFIHEGSNKKPTAPSISWLRKLLEKYDVGTGATRTSTIADVSDNTHKALLHESKGKLKLTEVGRLSYKLTSGCLIASPEQTDNLHKEMKQVAAGEISQNTVLEDVAKIVISDMNQMKDNLNNIEHKEPQQSCGQCPRCGQDVVKKQSGSYSCISNRWKKTNEGFVLGSGCGFILAKVYGTALTDSEAAELLASGTTTKTIKGKYGKQRFEIVLNSESQYGMDLHPIKGEAIGVCPRCGQDVIYKENGSIQCSSNRWSGSEGNYSLIEGCGFRMGSVYKKKLTQHQASQLLKEGHIPFSVKGKYDSKSRKVTLVLNPSSDWGFDINNL